MTREGPPGEEFDDRAAWRLLVFGVDGMPEVEPGDDLAALVAECAPDLHDGDVVVVTSKVVSKAEGRLLPSPTDDAGREAARLAAVDAEAVRVVAERGSTRIVQTRSGYVTAAAGVDASNLPRDRIALLPEDPDHSARALRDRLHALRGVSVAVVVTDSAGRPWREGLVDVAIGVAGMSALRDHRGRVDAYGNTLRVSAAADADAVAAAAELAKGKTAGVPVVVVRGLEYDDDGRGAAALVRRAEEDLFSLGTAEAMRAAVTARRSVRAFADRPVPVEVVRRAVAVALSAPAPHHTVPWRYVQVASAAVRTRLLDAMAVRWADDLRGDGLNAPQVARRLRRGDLLRVAPTLVVPCLVTDGAHAYPDPRRAAAEREMFVAAAGAGVENLLVALAADGVGSCWVSSTFYCRDVVRDVLELPASWDPVGAVAIGYPAQPPEPRPPRDPGEFLLTR